MKKVSVLLSVYKPNPDYLKKQLVSINGQTYGNIELIIRNDCPEDDFDYNPLLKECLDNIPFEFLEGRENLGYAKSFEKLIYCARGEYVSFCDQDDIWDKEKIEECVSALEKENGVFVVCDKRIIDANDNVTVESYRKSTSAAFVNWNTGDRITDRALFACYATGMAIIARTDDLKKVCPVPSGCAHDRWFAAALSALGKPVYLNKPLVSYRRAGGNVSGVLSGISSKKSYYTKRADNSAVITAFETLFPDYEGLERIKQCNKARMSGNPFGILKHKDLIPDVYKYELALSFCPGFVFPTIRKILFKG